MTAIIAAEVPGVIVGAGPVLDAAGVRTAQAAGAQFLVAPGSTRAVSEEAAAAGIPLVPGAVTATEVMQALEAGHRLLKFFPAATGGGIGGILSLAAPFLPAGVRFMPTGGIRADTLAGYLAEPAVAAVGGSWIATSERIGSGRFDEIAASARATVAIVREADTEGAAA